MIAPEAVPSTNPEGVTDEAHTGLLTMSATKGDSREFESVADSRLTKSGTDADPDDMTETHQDFAEDTFGMVTALLIRDLHFLQLGNITQENKAIRVARIFNTVILLAATVALQTYLLWQVKCFVTMPAVQDIRKDYDKYESAMYSRTEWSVNGFARGQGALIAEKFESLDEKMQEVVCSFPLSQPTFFFVILLMWTVRVCSEFKAMIKWFMCLIINTSNRGFGVYGMIDCFKDDDGNVLIDKSEENKKLRVVYRLPYSVKAGLVLFVGIPRFFVCSMLLWLGCRWLCATSHFEDLIMNAVGLEFVLGAKELLYSSLVPYRTKVDLSETKMMPFSAMQHGGLKLNIVAGMGTVGWMVIASAWCYLYMYYFQQVLPDYRWDIHAVCQDYLKKKYAFATPE